MLEISKRRLSLMASIFLLACGDAVVGSSPSDQGELDAGSTQADAGSIPSDLGHADASVRDAGPEPDVSSPDLGVGEDAGADAGSQEDGGEGTDSGVDPDQEVPIGGGLSLVRGGLYGGSIRALVRSPSQPDRLYAGTNGGGLFRSDNGGQRWSSSSMLGEVVRQIVVSSSDPDRLFVLAEAPRTRTAGSGPRKLSRSEDGAQSFEEASLPDSMYVSSVSFGGGQVWISGSAGTSARIYRSGDLGETWLNSPAPSQLNSTSKILAHSSDPDIAWVQFSGGIYRTGDSGQTWIDITPPIDSSEFIGGISLSPASPLRLWAEIANGRPFVSQDGGTTWQRVSSAPTNSLELFPDVDDADVVWASTNWDHTYRSANGGISWEVVTRPFSPLTVGVPSFSPVSAMEALAWGRGFEIHHTTNTIDWTRTVEGISAVWTRSVAISSTGDRMILGSDHGDVFISIDQGRSWMRSRAGLPPLAISAVAIDPNEPNTYYAGTGAGESSGLYRTNVSGAMFKSIDGGVSWTMLTHLRGNNWVSMISDIYVTHDGVVLAAAGSNGNYRSSNGGVSWEPMSPPNRSLPLDVRQVPGTSTTMITARTNASSTTGSFVVSSDLGSSWQPVGSAQGAINVDRVVLGASSRADALVHYALTQLSFGKFTGSSWGLAEVGLHLDTTNPQEFHAMAVGAMGGVDTLMMTGVFRGVDQWEPTLSISYDGAQTWSSRTLPLLGIPSMIAMAEAAPDIAIIGLKSGRGAMVTRNGAR